MAAWPPHASAKTRAVRPPHASAKRTVKRYLSDEMEPANFPFHLSSAPDVGTPAEPDPANYPLPASPKLGEINSTGAAISNPEPSCFLLRSVIESAEAISTDSRDFGSTESPSSSKQVASSVPVSNVQETSTNSSLYESWLLGTTACSQEKSGKAMQTKSRLLKAKLSSSAVSFYRTIRDFLSRILAFFGLVSPNSTVAATPLPPKLSTTLGSVDGKSSLIGLPAEPPSPIIIGSAVLPDPSSAAAAAAAPAPPPPPRAHFIRGAEGWVHRFEGGIETLAFKSAGDEVAEIPDGLTLGQALDNYKASLVSFKQSSSCAEITNLLENTLLKLPTMKISTCIATGLGTFTAPHPYCSENPETSLIQLAALEFILDVLRRKFSISTAYIQDPAMNVLDKQIVTSLGYTVLHDPEAMNAMTLTTFLYAPNNEFSVIENLLLVASPALYLGTELTFFYDNILIIPQHIHDEYSSQGIDGDNAESRLSKGLRVWSEPDGKWMSRKELVDAYISSNVKKANKLLNDYAQECDSWTWNVWGDTTTIYWMKN